LLKLLLLISFFYFFPFAQLQSIGSVVLKDTVNWTPSDIGFFFVVLGIGDMFHKDFWLENYCQNLAP